MGVSSDADRITDLERRVALIEALLDTELRERQHLPPTKSERLGTQTLRGSFAEMWQIDSQKARQCLLSLSATDIARSRIDTYVVPLGARFSTVSKTCSRRSIPRRTLPPILCG